MRLYTLAIQFISLSIYIYQYVFKSILEGTESYNKVRNRPTLVDQKIRPVCEGVCMCTCVSAWCVHACVSVHII